jgi:CHAT domain-containing protein
MRLGKQAIGALALVGLILLGAAQETPQPPQQPAPTHQDAPAPEPHPELKPLVEDIRPLLRDGKFQDALSKADDLLQEARARGDKVGEAYALRFRALALQRTRQTAPDQLPEVASVWASALALWREIGDEALQVEALLGQAYCLWRVSPEQAQALLQDALQLAKGEAKRPLAIATALHNIGGDWYGVGQLVVAEQLWQQALAIREKLAPNSQEVAATLNNLGAVAFNRGDLLSAQQYYQKILSIYDRISPSSLEMAATLNNLGAVMWRQGELARAEQLCQRALTIYGNSNPLEVAYVLLNLGNVAYDRSDLDRAKQMYQQALTLFSERLAPDSLQVAQTLNNLGAVMWRQDKLVQANQYYHQALLIYEKLVPGSLQVAQTLYNLGVVARNGGNLVLAEQYYRQALVIFEKLAPDTLLVAATLNSLGTVAAYGGELARAEQLYRRALTIKEKLAPHSLQIANTLENLARLARQQKNYPQAQQYLARALDIYETQRTTIQDPETKTAFAERYFNAYTLQAQLALDQQQPQQAALALERSRARTLAELMFTRALPVPDQRPPSPAATSSPSKSNSSATSCCSPASNARPTPTTQTPSNACKPMSRELADRQRQLDRQLREQFPAYADLLNPQPPNLKQLQAALDANTVLLYHAFADTELLIVAVSRQAVRGYRVKVDPRTLENDLAAFRKLVAKPPLERTASERRKLPALGQRLYATLIKPAEPSLKNATTVLLCPEGALNQLPWGALVVAVDKQGRPTYWVERVALGITLSAGVYLQAKAVRPAERGVAIAAVSQYRRQQVAQAPKTAQLVRRSGRALGDLPAVKQEVAQLRRLLGKQGVVVVQEGEATPERARQMAQRARVVHFACHARADGVDPLGSGLLLAPAGSDAGLLTAADVVSKWRLRADVVMLSACETAVGQVRRYEGMYGLARAFLFAGSRSVGASLWRVDDVSTARLMGAFYREYVRGVPKVEALRRAQVELLRSKDDSDPYYWSCFVLMGVER